MIWFGVSGFIIGSVLGSLVKALADRSLSDRSFWGRSYCPHCQNTLRWYDLFPVVSYLILRGRCRYCQRKIAAEYPVVEVVMGLLVGFLFWQSSLNLQTLCHPELVSGSNGILKPLNQVQGQNDVACISSVDRFQLSLLTLDLLFKTFFITVLAILFLTDLKKMLIPDRIVVPAIWISLIYLILTTLVKIGYLYQSLWQTTIGRLLLPPHSDYFRQHVLYTSEPFFLSILMTVLISGFFMVLIIITRGKGMGSGDVKLGGLMGLGLGFPQSLVALLLSFLSGALVAVILIILGKKHFGETLPFGPFLVLGSLMALFWGPQIVGWYMKLGT